MRSRSTRSPRLWPSRPRYRSTRGRSYSSTDSGSWDSGTRWRKGRMATRHRRPERSRRTLNMELLAGEDRFDTQIAYWAKEYGIPFALLKGMVSVESRFAEKAWREEPHIKDGSRGLMQILEKTARGIGFTDAADKLFEVDTNLKWEIG